MAPEDKQLAATLQELTDAAKQPEGARNILAMLFPKADAVLETYAPNDGLDTFGRVRERRISEAEFAPVYFRLDPAPISWSRSDLKKIIEDGPARGLIIVEERVRKFSAKDNAHLRRLFLDFLTALFSEREIFDSEWFYWLMEASPVYIKERERRPGDLLEDDGFMSFNRLLFHALKRQNPEERYQIVTNRLDEIADFSVFADFFRSTVGDTNPEGATQERQALFFGQETEGLRARLVAKIRSLAQSGKIWDQVSPSRLIWLWWGSNHGEEVRSFLLQSMRDPATLRKVLNLVIGTVVSSDGNYERVSRGYEKIVDLNALTAAASELMERQLDKEDAHLVNRYMQALKRSEDGPF